MAISSLAELIRLYGRERRGAPALSYEGRTRSYAECDQESSRVAQGLRAEGVGSQDRIAFLDKNSPAYFSFLFGGAKLNAVTVAVNWRLAPPEMEYILNDSEAKVLLVGEEFLGHLKKFGPNLKHVRKVVVAGSSPGHESYEEWLGRHPVKDPGASPAGADVCYQLYTSGTTGLPKGVEITNANLCSMLPTASKEWQFDSGSVNLVCMPLFHIAGSGWGVAGLFNGCHNVLTREVVPQEILRLIPEYRITNTLFVPALLQFLLAAPGVRETDFSSLRNIVYGASPITNEVLIRSMETFKCDFIQVYGLTETTGAITILRAEEHDPTGPRAELLRSAGRPWGDVSLRIVDTATGQDLPEGQVGEIWIRSLQNMKGYWKMPEATAEAILPGNWFRSGDAGYLKDGYLFIHDRVKDMIISGAENIYPAEVENVLMSHPQVADVAVIGVPDDKWGETVKALVTRAPGSQVTEEDLIGYCRERLAHFKCPTSVEWRDVIPRNPSGKLLKKELREPYWKGQTRRVH
jgi:long-chain acyl-CoA synthetase